MDARTFLNNFATIADAPGGVQRLRDCALRLAVMGQLGTQRDDEPAEVSVENAARELSGRAGPRGREASSQRLDGDAALFVGAPDKPLLPKGWTVVPLAAVSRLESGHTPDRKVPRYWDGPIPWIGIRDARANRDGVVWATEKTITQAGVDNSSARLLPAGTVCLSRTASVGYCVVMGEPMCTSQDFVNFVCTSALLPRYLQVLFMAERDSLRRFAKGAVHLTIYFPEVKAFHILLPPIAEQTRIVAKVDELMELCDQLEARQEHRRCATIQSRGSVLHALTETATVDDLCDAWERLDESWSLVTDHPDSGQDLGQAVLRLAVGGRLVAQDPTADEPAQRLLDELAERRGSLGVTLPSAERPSLPTGWTWASLGQATINRDADRVPLKRADRSERPGHYDYYGASGVIDQIDDYIFDGDLLLIGEDGANLVLRSTPIAFIASGRFWVNNHAHVLESVEIDALKYLAIFINSIDLRPYLTGIAQPKLNQARMNRIPVPIPPLAEQRRIVERVEQLVGMCDELSRALATQQSRQLDVAVAACHSMTRPHV